MFGLPIHLLDFHSVDKKCLGYLELVLDVPYQIVLIPTSNGGEELHVGHLLQEDIHHYLHHEGLR